MEWTLLSAAFDLALAFDFSDGSALARQQSPKQNFKGMNNSDVMGNNQDRRQKQRTGVSAAHRPHTVYLVVCRIHLS